MDRYVIFIYNGLPSHEDKQFFLNLFEKFLPAEQIYNENESESSNQSSQTSYLHFIDLNNESDKLNEWQELNSVDQINQFISSNNQCEDNFENKVLFESTLIAGNLNNLADQLPVCGSYLLDVIITCEVLKNFNTSDDIEFAASLHRLSKWHFAKIVFLEYEKTDPFQFKDWVELTSAEVAEDITLKDIDTVLWRGSLGFKQTNISIKEYDGFELRLSNPSRKLSNPLVSQIIDNCDSSAYHLILHPVMHAIDICNFSSIPQHIIFNSNLELYVSSNNIYNSSHRLCENFFKESGTAVILRMGYSVLRDKPKPDKSLSSNKWKKMILTGKLKYPESSYPDTEKYLTIAVTKSNNSSCYIAHLLRDTTSMNARFFFSAVNLWSKLNQKSSKQKEIKNSRDFNFSIPYISESSLHACLVEAAQTSKTNMDPNNLDSSCDLQDHNRFLSSLMALTDSSKNTYPHLCISSTGLIYDEIDPSDWPERMHLLQKQIQLEEEKKNLRNIFVGFSPQRSHYNVSFSCDDIKKYFQSSGEAKDLSKTEALQSMCDKVNKNTENLQDLMNKKWPEVLNCTHGDIYYNVNTQSEEIEKFGSDMVRCYIPHETASTCNNHQSQPDAPISVHAKYLTPRKKSKSSKSETTSLRQDIMKPNAKVKENLLKSAGMQSNSVISNVIKVLGVRKSPKHKTSTKDDHKRIPRKNTLPVRCSPRKKTSVCYFPPARNSASSSQVPKSSSAKEKSPNDLPDSLKKKLRFAVATALESNNIKMTDPVFKSYFKKLFQICLPFVQDLPREGSKSQQLQKIADALVGQVITLDKLITGGKHNEKTK